MEFWYNYFEQNIIFFSIALSWLTCKFAMYPYWHACSCLWVFCCKHFEQNLSFIYCILAASSFGSPLHRLVATLSSPFPRILLLKLSWISIAAASDDRPTRYPEVENTCPISVFYSANVGCISLSPQQYYKEGHPLLKQDSLIKPNKLFCSWEVQDAHNTKIITRNPNILTLNVDRQLKPITKSTKTLGLTAQDFANVITLCPRLLDCNIENTVSPNIRYLQHLFRSEADVSRVFKWAPQILIRGNEPENVERDWSIWKIEELWKPYWSLSTNPTPDDRHKDELKS